MKDTRLAKLLKTLGLVVLTLALLYGTNSIEKQLRNPLDLPTTSHATGYIRSIQESDSGLRITLEITDCSAELSTSQQLTFQLHENAIVPQEVQQMLDQGKTGALVRVRTCYQKARQPFPAMILWLESSVD